MFIQTEATPNPATMKFLPERTVLETGTLDIRNRDDAAQSPLAQRLFDVSGVSGVFFGSDFIAVTKDVGEWPQLKPMILGAIMEHFMSGAPIVDAHDGRPVTVGAGFTQETESEAESAETDRCLHDHRRSSTQRTVGHERPPGVAQGDGAGLRE